MRVWSRAAQIVEAVMLENNFVNVMLMCRFYCRNALLHKWYRVVFAIGMVLAIVKKTPTEPRLNVGKASRAAETALDAAGDTIMTPI